MVQDQEEVASLNMETRIAAMEYLVEKLTEVNVLCKKNQALKIRHTTEILALASTKNLDGKKQMTTNRKSGKTCRTSFATSKGNMRR